VGGTPFLLAMAASAPVVAAAPFRRPQLSQDFFIAIDWRGQPSPRRFMTIRADNDDCVVNIFF
jgi:hypothetical protein